MNLAKILDLGIGNVALRYLALMEVEAKDNFLPSIVRR